MTSMNGFDEDYPPSYEQVLACIHCGFCLQSCPTYRALGTEPDSPRGRLYLIRAISEDRTGIEADLVQHLYRCVLCRGCEEVCPSNVKFGLLMERARGQVEKKFSWPLGQRMVKGSLLGMLSSPRKLDLALSLLKFGRRSGLEDVVTRFSGTAKDLSRMVPDLPKKSFRSTAPEVTPPIGEKKHRVGMLTGCVMGSLLSHLDEATVRVLRVNGCEVVVPRNQTCCGAAAIHEGRLKEAKRLAKQTIEAFEGVDVETVVANSAGCGAFMKEYPVLLEDDPDYSDRAKQFSRKVRDVNEFLGSIDFNRNLGRVEAKVTYQEPCHLTHVQRIRDQPRRLINSIQGVELVEMKDSDLCCGAGATYIFSQPELSTRLLKLKMENIEATRANIVLTSNPPCYMQLQRGIASLEPKMKLYHIVELLDEAYKLSGAYQQKN